MSCTVHSPTDSLAQPTCILVYIECNPAPRGSPFELSLGLRSTSRVLLPPPLLRVSCVVVCPRFCLGSPQEALSTSSPHSAAFPSVSAISGRLADWTVPFVHSAITRLSATSCLHSHGSPSIGGLSVSSSELCGSVCVSCGMPSSTTGVVSAHLVLVPFAEAS